MLQRPQTLLFLAAAIITALITFTPFCSYQPEDVKNNDNARITVSASDIDLVVDYDEEIHGDADKFNKRMENFNEEIDEKLEEDGVSILLTIGMLGMLLLAGFIAVVAFLYSNRKIQIRMGIVVSIVTVFVTLGVFVASRVGLRIFEEMDILPRRLAQYDWEITYSWGFFMLPLVIGLILTGVVLVRKDDNLIKSIDRIR